ncbi:MAG: penicillin-binding transpeptidase domain-containing protein [Anaerolineae bacterium]
MTRNIGRVAGFLIGMFALLTVGMTYWSVVRGPELAALPNNARTVLLEQQIQRGRILDRNGQVLADTKMTPDGPQRVYTYPSLAPVLGYFSAKHGVAGVEEAFNDDLRGIGGADPMGALRWRFLHQAPVGRDVSLTLDLRLQQVADNLLGNRRGAIVLMNNDGEVLAMASHPTYDPNRLDETFAQLSADPAAPLLNRATQGRYPPGSTWKTFTLAAALDAGVTRPDQKFDDGAATLNVRGFPIRCNNNPPGVNTFDLAHAFGYSCNLTFARLALELGAQRYMDYASRFRADKDLPLEIPVAKSQIANKDLSDEVLLASTGFGQGELQITPIQMAMIGATVANDGKMPMPHLLKEIKDKAAQVVRRPQTGTLATPISPQTAQQVRDIMGVAVSDGYASGARIPNVQVGGKTGTAETGPNTAPHAWFLAQAPLDKARRYTVAVLVENGGEGSTVAAPIAQKMLAAALQSGD